jgi:hypothetical protein
MSAIAQRTPEHAKRRQIVGRMDSDTIRIHAVQ